MIARVRELQNQNEKAASGGSGEFAMWSGMLGPPPEVLTRYIEENDLDAANSAKELEL